MAGKKQDDYQPLEFYQTHARQLKNGFAKFKDGKSFYFAMFKDSAIVMVSQAYVSIAGRNNGIQSVRTNSKLHQRFVFKTRAGQKHGFALKARNGREIAISPDYTSQSEAKQTAARLHGPIKLAKKKTAAKKKPRKKTTGKASVSKSDKRMQNFKPVEFFEAHASGTQNGFDSFDEGNAFYFTHNQGGKIALLSKSYTSKTGRDNGIKSVMQNMPIKERYEHIAHSNGKHFFNVKAGNHQPVATSIWHDSKQDSLSGAAALRGEKTKSPRKKNDEDNYRRLAFYNKHTKGRKSGIESFVGDDDLHYFAYFENGKIRLISEGYPTIAARDTGIASVEKNIKLPSRYEYRGPLKNGKFDYRLKAGNGKEIARSIWYGSAAAAATGAAYVIGTRKRVTPKPVVSPAAISPAKPKTVTAPKTKAKPKVSTVAPIAVAATAAAAKGAAAMPRDKDDDYLKCQAYHGHQITDKKNNLAFFSHDNNKEYFVIYDDRGDVLIRSEGFDSISKRSSELAAVLRLKDNPDNFTRIEKSGHYMDILKDEHGREVGRSCRRKVAPPVVAAAPIVKTAAAAVPTVAKPTATAAATGGFSWGWLKWLLPLLLLLLLLFGLKTCKADPVVVPPALVTCWDESEAESDALCPEKISCWDGSFAQSTSTCPAQPPQMVTCWDGSKAETSAACPAEPTPEVATPAKPPAATAPTRVTSERLTSTARASETTAVNLSRICGESETLIFSVPAYSTPVSINRLGTFPEFGDSHDLSPAEFYDKLASRFGANEFDRQYLDYLATSLGYTNGFSDMSASDFSDDRLPQGAKGLLGFGTFHGTAYSQLNVRSKRDLEAFRVRAVNGTDIHFMKTCGNYMYVCN